MNLIRPVSAQTWTYYSFINGVILPGVIGVVSTVWFTVGGVIDMRKLFRDLKNRPDNTYDDGWVDGNVSRADQKAVPMTAKFEGECVALGEGEESASK